MNLLHGLCTFWAANGELGLGLFFVCLHSAVKVGHIGVVSPWVAEFIWDLVVVSLLHFIKDFIHTDRLVTLSMQIAPQSGDPYLITLTEFVVRPNPFGILHELLLVVFVFGHDSVEVGFICSSLKDVKVSLDLI